MKSFLALLADPKTRPFFVSQFVSQVGSALFEIATIWLTLETTGSPLLTSIVAASAFLPALLSPFAGAVSDFVSPKRLIVTLDLVRAAIVLGLALVTIQAGFPAPGVVVVLSLILGLCTRIYIPARYSWLPQVVPRDRLQAANALSSLIANARLVVGGLLTLVVFALGDPALVFVLNAMTYLASAVVMMRVARPATNETATTARPPVLARLRDGFVAVAARRDLSLVFGFVAASNLVQVGGWIVGAPLVAEALAGAKTYTALQASFGLGVAAGCVIVGAAALHRAIVTRVVWLGFVARAVGFVGLASVASEPIVLISALLVGVGMPAMSVTVPSILQVVGQRVGHTGQLFGIYGLVNAGAVSVSIFLFGALGERMAVEHLLLVAAVACGALALVTIGSGRFVRALTSHRAE